MPLTDRNIVITPQGPLGAGANEPVIRFTGGTAASSASTFLRVLDDGTISFEGTAGQLLAIQDTLAGGDIFTVTDRSGIPSLEIEAAGAVKLAHYQGTVFIGNNIPSTSTSTGNLQVLGGVGVSGNLNIGGSFAMNANLGVGGAGSTYAITVSTTTNVAGYFSETTDGSGVAIQVGRSTWPLGFGLNSYNNVGTTFVMATGHSAQVELLGAELQFKVSSASQSANAIATQLLGLSVASSGITVPQGTASSSTGTGALIVYGGTGIGGDLFVRNDGRFNNVRVGTGNSNISSNTVVGNAAGNGLLTGGGNLLIGFQAGTALTSSANNTAIGYQALLAQTATGGNNVAIGYQAMYTSNNTGMINNTAIGYRALGLGNGSMNQNTAIGYQALANTSNGASNTAIGYNAANQLTTGNQNVCIGLNAGNALGAQSNVVIIGSASGSGVADGTIILADGAANTRMDFAGSTGNARIYSTTAANGTSGVGALRVDGGLSVASGLTIAGGAVYAGGSAGTNGFFLQTTGTGVQWAQAGVSVADDTTTNGTRYITFTASVSGSLTTLNVSSSKLTYNPSTGIITGAFNGPHNGTVGATTAASGNFTTLNGTQLTITNGGTTHAITGPASNALTVSNGVGNGSGVCLNVAGSGDVNLTSGGSLFFGNYNYGTGTYIRGNGSGELNFYRAGNLNIQTTGNNTQINGILYVTGDIYANFSDMRLKTAVSPITGALEKVLQLEGFYYEANEKAKQLGVKDTGRKVGLSAQKAKEIMPEVVGISALDVTADGKSKSGEEILSLQYERLVPLLVEAIKEQQQQIEQLKAEIKALKQ